LELVELELQLRVLVQTAVKVFTEWFLQVVVQAD
jgi:hypothetical protein